jgi:TetR/AcrR family transcriptional regulator, regulator of cefoperazone and chloramphenicol sensitivity
MNPAPSQPGDATRAALITAAIKVFSRDGFSAVSTRKLAAAAGVNQALIGYHFRNKEGLYLAAVEHIASEIGRRIGPVVAQARLALATPRAGNSKTMRQDANLQLLYRLTNAMVAMMAHDDTAPWAQLIMREQQAPTAAFELLYDSFMGPTMSLMTQIVAHIRGSNDKMRARLIVVAILGQVLAWRTARTGVLRLMGWTRIGASELAHIQGSLRRSVRALVLDQD